MTTSGRLAEKRTRLLYPILSCVIPLALLLISQPFAPEAFVDDWSYSDVALKLAQTGHLHYNGWGGSMILFQTIWGAIWIRVFTFSFDLLRVATIPFSIGFVFLVYLTGRKSGLSDVMAMFGALLVGTSPLFLPLAASFMTDPYGCFFTALCIYAALCGADAKTNRSVTLWLWFLALSGIVGGSDRQSVWAAPIVLIPYLFWVRRSDRGFRIQAAIAYGMCLVCLGLLVHYLTQPYAPLDLLHLSRADLWAFLARTPLPALGNLLSLSLSCLMLALPAFVAYAPAWKRLDPGFALLLLLGCSLTTIVLLLMFGPFALAPFAGDIVSPFGVFWEGEDALGLRPTLLTVKTRIVLTLLVEFSVAGFFYFEKRGARSTSASFQQVFALFSCAYIPLLIPGALAGLCLDRYVLPLLPLVVIYVLVRFSGQRKKIPAIAWVFLGAFALYSAATTHDFFSAIRARSDASRILQSAGVPRDRISAGFEHDGWTQIQRTGKIKASLPADFSRSNTTSRFWFWSFTPGVQPDYVVTYSPHAGALEGMPSVSYRAWLPPFRRYVTAYKRGDLPQPASVQ